VASVALRGLTKRFGSQTVLDDISLEVESGKLVCLLGPSGCGKTTALRLVAGFMEPTAGEIALGNRVVSSPARTLPPEQRNVSMVFQSYALWPHMTVAQNVAYGLELRKLARADIARKVAAILATTRLAPLAERYPAELSGGQQQRVSLARALIVEPDTLLLDEPLSNLDANLREEMRFEVRRLHDTYRYTTIYVTHDQSEAMTTADLIAVMSAGRIEQLGTPQEVYEQPRSEFTARFLGGSNILRGKAARRDAHRLRRRHDRLLRRADGGGRRRGRVGAPARGAACRGGACRARQRGAGHGSAQRVSREHPRLYRRGGRRHAAAHHRPAGAQPRPRRAGVARAAARAVPGAGGVSFQVTSLVRSGRWQRTDDGQLHGRCIRLHALERMKSGIGSGPQRLGESLRSQVFGRCGVS
jgi:iron(III) transport system ATP-binding protein